MARRLGSAVLALGLAAVVISCSDESQDRIGAAVSAVREDLSGAADRAQEAYNQATASLSTLAPDLQADAQAALDQANTALTDAKATVSTVPEQLDDQARSALEDARDRVDAAATDLQEEIDARPELRSDLDALRQRLADLRQQIDDAL